MRTIHGKTGVEENAKPPLGFAAPDEITESVTIEKILDSLHINGAGLNLTIKQYGGSVLRGATGTANILSGNFDLSSARIDYYKDFFPSPAALRSCFYLQSLAKMNFGPRYFTIRESVRSYLLVQTIRGAGRLVYLGKIYEMQPDDVFLIDCRKPHDYRSASAAGWEYRMAHFDGAAMPDFYSQILSGGSVKVRFNRGGFFYELFGKLFSGNYSGGSGSEFLTHCILTELITEILKVTPLRTNELPERIKHIREWLSAHCVEKLSLDCISREAAMSKYHLSREFKRWTGKSIFNFISEARIHTAKRLLRYTDLPISDITEHIGFEDQSHFCRLFHRFEGSSPAAYRKEWKGV
jgi:AraC-like DNA-binding protein